MAEENKLKVYPLGITEKEIKQIADEAIEESGAANEVPMATIEDAGKIIKVGDDGKYELAEESGGGGGVSVDALSNTDTLEKHILSSEDVIQLPDTITESSTIQDIINLNVGVNAPTGQVDNYVIAFAQPLGYSGAKVFSLTFFPYGQKSITLKSDPKLVSATDIINKQYYTASSDFELSKPLSQFTKSDILAHKFVTPCDAETEGTYTYKCTVSFDGSNYTYTYSWEMD